MYRRLLIAALCALMTLGAAVAETRESTILLEGMPETVTLTSYDGDGFRLWYDAGRYAMTAAEGASSGRLLPADAADDAIAFSFEIAADGQAPDALAASRTEALTREGYTVTALDDDELLAVGARVTAGCVCLRGDELIECFVVTVNDRALLIELRMPLEAAEGAGARFRRVIADIEPIQP